MDAHTGRPNNLWKIVAALVALAALLGCAGMLGLCLLAAVIAPPPTPPAIVPVVPAPSAPALPTYRVVSNELHEDMVKAQVEVRVVVTGNVTRGGLEALLRQLHAEAKARSDLRHHEHVGYTLIGAYAPHQRIGQEIPLANLSSVRDATPVIQLDEALLRRIEQAGGDPSALGR